MNFSSPNRYSFAYNYFKPFKTFDLGLGSVLKENKQNSPFNIKLPTIQKATTQNIQKQAQPNNNSLGNMPSSLGDLPSLGNSPMLFDSNQMGLGMGSPPPMLPPSSAPAAPPLDMSAMSSMGGMPEIPPPVPPLSSPPPQPLPINPRVVQQRPYTFSDYLKKRQLSQLIQSFRDRTEKKSSFIEKQAIVKKIVPKALSWVGKNIFNPREVGSMATQGFLAGYDPMATRDEVEKSSHKFRIGGVNFDLLHGGLGALGGSRLRNVRGFSAIARPYTGYYSGATLGHLADSGAGLVGYDTGNMGYNIGRFAGGGLGGLSGFKHTFLNRGQANAFNQFNQLLKQKFANNPKALKDLRSILDSGYHSYLDSSSQQLGLNIVRDLFKNKQLISVFKTLTSDERKQVRDLLNSIFYYTKKTQTGIHGALGGLNNAAGNYFLGTIRPLTSTASFLAKRLNMIPRTPVDPAVAAAENAPSFMKGLGTLTALGGIVPAAYTASRNYLFGDPFAERIGNNKYSYPVKMVPRFNPETKQTEMVPIPNTGLVGSALDSAASMARMHVEKEFDDLFKKKEKEFREKYLPKLKEEFSKFLDHSTNIDDNAKPEETTEFTPVIKKVKKQIQGLGSDIVSNATDELGNQIDKKLLAPFGLDKMDQRSKLMLGMGIPMTASGLMFGNDIFSGLGAATTIGAGLANQNLFSLPKGFYQSAQQ